jgi:AbrB family looped-hinge helix DNA binding protein
MLTAKVSSKGKITLPLRVRQALNVQPGGHVLFVVRDKSVLLRPIGPNNPRTLAGSLRLYGMARQEVREARATVKKVVARAAAQQG